MFGFLKNKLKEWVDKEKDTLKTEEEKPEAVVEEKKETVKPKKEEKIAKKEKPAKKEEVKKEQLKVIKEPKKEKRKKEKTADESKFEELVQDAKSKEDIKEVPLEFNPALNKYEPNLEKIRKSGEETLEEKEFILTEEIQKEQELPVLPEELTAKKQGFISRLFSKKSKTNIESSGLEKSEIAFSSEIKKEPVIKGEKPEVPIEPIGEVKKEVEPVVEQPQKKSFLQKVKSSLTYKISQDDFSKLFDDLEMLLLENNVALEVVEDLKKFLSKKLMGKEIKKDNLENEIKIELKNSLNELIIDPQNPLDAIKLKKEKPFVILFFGINGSGKTTSIAKIASLFRENNLSVVLAAADTFRAASIEQIAEHANKLQIPLIKHDYQSDPAAVGFDAIKYAKTHRIDVVLIDTAGRMHTKTNLLAEMEKIVRVTNPDLKIFVAESIAGNDATEQSKAFNEMIGIDGSILSKADVDEKGGTIISVSHATKKPIIYLGTGQAYKDLKFFNKKEYIESLGL